MDRIDQLAELLVYRLLDGDFDKEYTQWRVKETREELATLVLDAIHDSNIQKSAFAIAETIKG